jgi:phosphoheptose isomerase
MIIFRSVIPALERARHSTMDKIAMTTVEAGKVQIF